MSLSYSNLPVYVGAANASTITENTAYVPALQAGVDFNANLSPKRVLGESVSTTDQFKVGEPMGVNINLQAVLDPFAQDAFAFADSSNHDAYFPIKVGDNVYQKCYLNDFVVSVDNFQPVNLRASFICLDPPTGGNVSGDATPYGGGTIPFDSDDIIYGYNCTFTNPTDVVGDVQYRVEYNKKFSRTPIYTLGSINASSMLLNGVNAEMNISSTGLNKLIDFSGEQLASNVSLALTNIDGTSLSTLPSLTMSARCKVATEGYSINGGDTLTTSATIRQIIL